MYFISLSRPHSDFVVSCVRDLIPIISRDHNTFCVDLHCHSLLHTSSVRINHTARVYYVERLEPL